MRAPWVPSPLSFSLFLFLFSLSVCLFPSVTASLPYPPRSRSRSALPVKVSAFHGHRDHARPTHSRGCEISDLRERCWTDRWRRVSVWALACAGDSRERGVVRAFAAAAARIEIQKRVSLSLSPYIYPRHDHPSDMCLAYLIARVRRPCLSLSLVSHAIAVIIVGAAFYARV